MNDEEYADTSNLDAPLMRAVSHLVAALALLDKERRFDVSVHVDTALIKLRGFGIAPDESFLDT